MNPYQDVIDWLRSPEGEDWSERRICAARCQSNNGYTLNYYGRDPGDPPEVYLGGILSVKEG